MAKHKKVGRLNRIQENCCPGQKGSKMKKENLLGKVYNKLGT
jgi:hypothetical protein